MSVGVGVGGEPGERRRACLLEGMLCNQGPSAVMGGGMRLG